MVLRVPSATKDYIRAKNKLNLSASYSANKSSNHKFSKIYRIGPDTNIYKTKHRYTNVKDKIVEDSDPSVLPLLKKDARLGHAGIVDHSVNLAIPDFKNV